AMPRTSSTSFILCTGLKKCMPTTRSGWGTAVAISVTLSAEVFVAMMASGSMWAAAVATTCFFTAMFSVTVSTSSAAPADAAARSACVVSLDFAASATAASSLPRRTPSSRILATAESALAAAASLLSTSTVTKPELAKAWAMPVPIRPPPATTTLFCVMLMYCLPDCLLGCRDDVAQQTDAGNLGLDHVTGLEKLAGTLPRAGRRAGEHDIAALETRALVHELHQFRDIPGHLGRV